jgi:hypothetical protein
MLLVLLLLPTRFSSAPFAGNGSFEYRSEAAVSPSTYDPSTTPQLRRTAHLPRGSRRTACTSVHHAGRLLPTLRASRNCKPGTRVTATHCVGRCGEHTILPVHYCFFRTNSDHLLPFASSLPRQLQLPSLTAHTTHTHSPAKHHARRLSLPFSLVILRFR